MAIPLLTLHALLPGDDPPDLAAVGARLEAEDPELHLEHLPARGGTLRSRDPDDPWTLHAAPAGGLPDAHADVLEADAETVRRASASTWSLVLAAPVSPGRGPDRFGRLLDLALTAAPDTVAVLDPDAVRLHAPARLRAGRRGGVPVALPWLYRLRAWRLADRPGRRCVRTEGLRRLGLADVELHDAPSEHLDAAQAWVRAVAHRGLVHGYPPEGATAAWGRSLHAALVSARYTLPGIHPDHDTDAQRGEHAHGTDLVLVRWVPDGPESGHWASAALALDDLSASPVFFVTDYDTDRMEAVARLRWRTFALLVDHLADDPAWRFLAKFSYGGDGDHPTREHLWFEVESADALGATGALVSPPYQDLGLEAGARGHHPVERLTDFRVVGPDGVVGPDDLDAVLHALRG